LNHSKVARHINRGGSALPERGFMTRRKIWVGLGTALLATSPAAQTALATPPARAGDAQSSSPSAWQVAQHQGHAVAQAEGEGEGEGGGAELPADLRFYRDIELIRGHLLVGNELVEAGRWADALPHFLHPEEEIYNGLREGLKTHKVSPFLTALKSLTQTVKAKNKEAYARARAAVEERLVGAEAAVRAGQADAAAFAIETALEVLQVAAEEYEAAIAKGRIANVVEYQDARGFVLETERLIGTHAPALSAKNADALKAVQASLGELKGAFPAAVPPAKPVRDAGQFLSAVSGFELQVGKLQ
jgi:hypothetical protein